MESGLQGRDFDISLCALNPALNELDRHVKRSVPCGGITCHFAFTGVIVIFNYNLIQ